VGNRYVAIPRQCVRVDVVDCLANLFVEIKNIHSVCYMKQTSRFYTFIIRSCEHPYYIHMEIGFNRNVLVQSVLRVYLNNI